MKCAAPDFDLRLTLNSGQVFHWTEEAGKFYGTIGEMPCVVSQEGSKLIVHRGEAEVVAHYFALDHPMKEVEASLPKDETMQRALAACRGMRIMRQPAWECLATFITSSMKQVAHIRQMSLALRERFGEEQVGENTAGGGNTPLERRVAPSISSQEEKILSQELSPLERRWKRSAPEVCSPLEGFKRAIHLYPTPARLALASEVELRACGLGYRAKNLLKTAHLVAEGYSLEGLRGLDDRELRAALCALPGVGAKVANCVMLFAYERLGAFPVDVWIERVLRATYLKRRRKLTAGKIQAFADSHFGPYGGYAQQYLFHAARTRGRSLSSLTPVPRPGPDPRSG